VFVVTLDVNNLPRMRDFWSEVLHYRAADDDGVYVSLRPPKGARGVSLTLQRVSEVRSGKSRLHLDVITQHLDDDTDRLVALGAVRGDWFHEFGETWIVFTDPEGNEFCLVEDNGQRM
jgi:catechol 2,3-dioxygenase-like lactoylglutathione lyase family enzyme